MSIDVTVRPQGNTSGGDVRRIEGDGAIDTVREAEDALSFIGTSGNVAVINAGRSNEQVYTRAQLEAIRDGRPAVSQDAGPSHGLSIEGYYTAGLSDVGHSGLGLRAGYHGRFPLSSNQDPATIRVSAGIDVGGGNLTYTLPGSMAGANNASSNFTRVGASVGAGIHSPGFIDHRVSVGAGGRVGVGYFGTPASTIVMLPQTCTPDDFGRGECEPNAGPRTGNGGNTGLFNPQQGNSRGTNGVAIQAALPVTASVRIAQGSWGSVSAAANAELGVTTLLPSDGHGVTFGHVAAGLGVEVVFGGYAATRSVSSSESRTTTAASQTRAAGASLVLADSAAVRSFGGLPSEARILGVQFDNLPEDTEAPYEVPASSMIAGNHQLSIRYRNPDDSSDRFRIVPITINATEVGNGANFGAVLNIPANVERPAPDMVNGTSTPRDIPIGNIQTVPNFSSNATYSLFVDGNPVRENIPLPADRNTVLTLPAAVADGSRQVQVRVMRPGQEQITYPTANVVIGPAISNITNAAVQPPSSGASFAGEQIRVRFNTSMAGEHRVRVNVGSHAETITVPAGTAGREYTATLGGAPRSWTDTGGVPDRRTRRYTVPVSVTPLGSGDRTGTTVQAGSVTISAPRAAGRVVNRNNTPPLPHRRLPGAGGR